MVRCFGWRLNVRKIDKNLRDCNTSEWVCGHYIYYVYDVAFLMCRTIKQ
jgi:hypothetical protein